MRLDTGLAAADLTTASAAGPATITYTGVEHISLSGTPTTGSGSFTETVAITITLTGVELIDGDIKGDCTGIGTTSNTMTLDGAGYNGSHSVTISSTPFSIPAIPTNYVPIIPAISIAGGSVTGTTVISAGSGTITSSGSGSTSIPITIPAGQVTISASDSFSLVLTSPDMPPALSNWNGGTGLWSSASGWTQNIVPDTGFSSVSLGGSNGFTLSIDAGQAYWVQNLTLADAAANLTVAGTLTSYGTASVNEGDLSLAGGVISTGALNVSAGATLSGNGTLSFTGGSALVLAGSIAAAGGTLAVTDAISGAGTLSAAAGAVLDLLGGGSFAGNLDGAGKVDIATALTLSQGAKLNAAKFIDTANVTLGANTALRLAAHSILDIAAAKKTIVTIGGPSSANFTNAGSLAANNAGTAAIDAAIINNGHMSVSSGTLSFLGAVTNNGMIDQTGGLLSIKNTMSGTGTLEIGAGATASLALGAGSGQTVDFFAGTGLLDLASPIDFKAIIDGFGASDKIDLLKTPETSFAFSDGVLTVMDGGKTGASLHFGGSYTASSFALASDAHGGIFITFS
jgi:hypothetical protein